MQHGHGNRRRGAGIRLLADGRPGPGSVSVSVWSVAVVAVLLMVTVDAVVGETRSPRVVTTKYGQLRGVIRPLDNKQLKPVEVFLGVPYATPPTGSNRFSPTRTPSPWSGERVADQYGPVCPQHLPELWGEESEASMPSSRLRHLRHLANYVTHQAEDCLYLNLYVPAQVTDSVGHGALPVVVFIPGESFEWGAANPYDGSVLAAHGEVIVITLNYRLGPLGFLNTNADPSGRGHVMNHGLMDQIAALHWVQENIAVFGGDPGSVTLVGHGTGAACIHFLMTSAAVVPGLFQRAVLMSGSALSPWATVATPTHYALQFGQALNCTTVGLYRSDLTPSNKELDEMVNCLKDKPLDELQAIHITAPEFLPAFGPSVDGIVIKNDYRREMRKRADDGSREYDLMFGVVPQESYNYFTNDDIESGLSLRRRDRIFRTMIRNSYDYHLNEVFISAVNEYTDWEQPDPDPLQVKDAALDALSDSLYVAPLLTAANNLRMGHKNQFFYVLQPDNIHSDDSQAQDPHSNTPHIDALALMLGAPLVTELGVYSGNWTRSQRLVSQAALTFVANFAKTGNPNLREDQDVMTNFIDNRFRGLTWEKYDPLHQKYLAISGTPQVRHHYRAPQVALWTWLIPRLQRVGRLEFLTLRDPEAEDADPEELLEELTVAHHLYNKFDDPDLYSGRVRPIEHMAGHYVLPTTTTTTTISTPTILTRFLTTHPGMGSGFGHEISPNVTARTEATKPEVIGNVAYSTALSVTITIGVSLLILNALIFAGVYYQRDRSRMGNKQEQQSQQTSQSSSEQQMIGLSSASTPIIGLSTHVELLKAPLTVTSIMAPPPSPLTHFTHLTECPPAFADPPCTTNIPEQVMPVVLVAKPNGSATMLNTLQQPKQTQDQQKPLTLPRPPPHPRLISTESQPLLPVQVPAPPKGRIPPYDELRL